MIFRYIYTRIIYIIIIIIALIEISNARQDGADNFKQNPLLSSSVPFESSPMVSAVLLECPRTVKQKPSEAEKLKRVPCEQQLMVNIRVNPSFHIEQVEKFLILDEVYDSRKQSKAKIMSPYLIEISRGEPIMMYPLEFAKSVKYDDCNAQQSKSESGPTGSDKQIRPQPPTNNENKSCQPHEPMEQDKQELQDKSDKQQNQQCKSENLPSSNNNNNDSEKSNNIDSSNNKCNDTDQKPGQDSLNKVFDQISDCLVRAMKLYPSRDKANQQRPIDNKNPYQQTVSNAYNLDGNNEYDKLQSYTPLEQKYNIRKVRNSSISSISPDSENNVRLQGLEFFPADSDIPNDNLDHTIRDRREKHTMANVGIDSSLARKLEGHSKMAQLGLIKSKVNRSVLIDIKEQHDNVPYKAEAYTNPIAELLKQSQYSLNNNNGDDFERNIHYWDSIVSKQKMVEPESDNIEKLNEKLNDNIDLFNNNKNFNDKLIKTGHTKNRRIGKTPAKQRSSKHKSSDGIGEKTPFDRLSPIQNKEGLYNENSEGKRKSYLNTESDGTESSFVNGNNDKTISYGSRQNNENLRDSFLNNNKDDVDMNKAKKRLQNKIKIYRMVPQKENLNTRAIKDNSSSVESKSTDEQQNEAKEHELDVSADLNEMVNLKPIDWLEQDNDKLVTDKDISYMMDNGMSDGDTNDMMTNGIRDQDINYMLTNGIRDNLWVKRKHVNPFRGKGINKKQNYESFKRRFSNKMSFKPRGRIYLSRADGNGPKMFQNKLNSNPNNRPYVGNVAKLMQYHPRKDIYAIAFDGKNRKNMLNKVFYERRMEDNNNYYKGHNYDAESNRPKNEYNKESYASMPQYEHDFIQHDRLIHNDSLNNAEYEQPYWSESNRKQPMFDAMELSDNYYMESPNKQIQPRLHNYNGQYSKIISTQQLNTFDKPNDMDVDEPHNENAVHRLNQLPTDMEEPFIIQSTPYPLPIVTSSQIVDQDNIRKRSSAFYDDVVVHDNMEDNDSNFDNVPVQPNYPRHIYDDVQPCTSCGGKGKKPSGKTDLSNLPDNSFRGCRNNNCKCPSDKGTRSIADTWYSVFNMSAPLPFLTTKLRIFRKRHNTWWRIAPSITLNSLSGIFANANLSILFSSHVDIFHLEKSFRLQNHQLLIPKDDKPFVSNSNDTKSNEKLTRKVNSTLQEDDFIDMDFLNMNPNFILAINSNKIDLNTLITNHQVAATQTDQHADEDITTFLEKTENQNSIASVTSPKGKRALLKKRYAKQTSDNGIRTIAELGYFPATMNVLERCPNDKNRLCLNMLDDKAPAFSFKVKMPFRENAIVPDDVFKVKISTIVTDASTKNALQVSVDVVNEGLRAHHFSMSVNNCPISCGTSKTSVQKFLLPHIGETITFLLPLIMEPNQKRKKFTCDVTVQAMAANATLRKPDKDTRKPKMSNGDKSEENVKTIAFRQLLVEPDSRCFCVWECSCHCVPKLETHEDNNICKKLSYKEEKQAGLLIHCQSGDDVSTDICMGESEDEGPVAVAREMRFEFYGFLHNALILLIVVLILGLLKAIFGLCSKSVNACGYEYVQPGSGYDDASRCRTFFVNIFFFVIFPFLFWCKCFTPSDEDLLVASTEWQCDVLQEKQNSGSDTEDTEYYLHERGLEEDEEEDVILTQHIDRHFSNSMMGNRMEGGHDDIQNRLSDFSLNFNEDVFNDIDDEDEEANTKFILQALVESRESLKKLLRDNSSNTITDIYEQNSKTKMADELVQTLKNAQIVYRTFEKAVGNVRNMPRDCKYSIQGYFLPSVGAEYEFVSYNPLAQHRYISDDGKVLLLRPPVLLCTKEFSRIYANKLEVLEANDLSVHSPADAPCINVTTMASVASSVVKLASEHSYCKNLTHSVIKKPEQMMPKVTEPETRERQSREPPQNIVSTQSIMSHGNDTGLADNNLCQNVADGKGETANNETVLMTKSFKCDTIYE